MNGFAPTTSCDAAARGLVTGASGRNWAANNTQVTLPAGFSDIDIALLNDPQTSGGLLVSCRPDAVDPVLEIFRSQGFAQAAPAQVRPPAVVTGVSQQFGCFGSQQFGC